MNVMWSQSDPYQVPSEPISLEPSRVLYYFDGLQIFCATFGFLETIFVKLDDGNDGHRFLAATTNSETVQLVETAKLSVRGAFMQPNCWVIETDFNYSVLRYWILPKDELCESMLPKSGVALLLGAPRVPDTIEQAKAFFSIAFRGASVSRGRMPFSSLKNLVDDAYTLAKKVLTPPALMGSRSTTFDLIVEPTIGSLIISIDKPTIRIDRVNRRLNAEYSVEQISSAITEKRNDFIDAFSLITENPSTQTNEAESARDFVYQFRTVLPTDDTSYASVEFSALVDDEIKTVYIDTNTGNKIKRFFEDNDSERASRSGRIVEINSKARTFMLSGRLGRIVTCVLSDEAFADPKLKIGNHAEVSGQLYRRPRRDKMYVSTYQFENPAKS